LLVDSELAAETAEPDEIALTRRFVRELALGAGAKPPSRRRLLALEPGRRWSWLAAEGVAAGVLPPGTSGDEMRGRFRVYAANARRLRGHRPRRYPGPAALLLARDRSGRAGDPAAVWAELCDAFLCREVPGDHYSLMAPSRVDAVAREIDSLLEASEKGLR
jgi:hypothetical protein